MSDPTIATWILLGSFAIFLVLKAPITFSLAVSSVLTAIYLSEYGRGRLARQLSL